MMKLLVNVNSDYSIKNLFHEHIQKLNSKHEKEINLLEDVKSFIEKKAQIELDYSQSLNKLCQQFSKMENYVVTHESSTDILIPSKWKLILEEFNHFSEKRIISSESILLYVELCKSAKEKKIKLHEMAINNLKSLQQNICKTYDEYLNSYKTYCFEELLNQVLNKKLTLTEVHEKLVKKKISLNDFINTYEIEKKKQNALISSKTKTDISKLNYVINQVTLNQELQYYFSVELPEIMHLQNAEYDYLTKDLIDVVFSKEYEICEFAIQRLKNFSADCPKDDTSENHVIRKNSVFKNLIQLELEPYDTEKNFAYNIDKTNSKFFAADFHAWKEDLARLENETKEMNEKLQENLSQTDYKVFNEDRQKLKCKLRELKLKSIKIQSKIDALAIFNIDSEEFTNNFSKIKIKNKLDEELYNDFQNWDNLIKTIDVFNRTDTNDSIVSQLDISPLKFPKYAQTLFNYEPPNGSEYLPFKADSSLILYDEVSPGWYKSKDIHGNIGLVPNTHIQFIQDTVTAKALYEYNNPDAAEELSFPAGATILILRKNTNEKGLGWHEGVYDDRIGFFPSVYVEIIRNSPSKKFDFNLIYGFPDSDDEEQKETNENNKANAIEDFANFENFNGFTGNYNENESSDSLKRDNADSIYLKPLQLNRDSREEQDELVNREHESPYVWNVDDILNNNDNSNDYDDCEYQCNFNSNNSSDDAEDIEKKKEAINLDANKKKSFLKKIFNISKKEETENNESEC